MKKNVFIGKTDIDWNKVLSDVSAFGTAYLGYRASVKTGSAAQPGGGTTTIITQPTPMSNTTKTLLIGGGILAAGLIIYSLTKKK